MPVLVALVAACGPERAPDDTVTVRSALSTVLVTVVDQAGVPQFDVPVMAMRNSGSVTATAWTNANGQASLSLTANPFRFATEEGGIQFYSGAAGHCVTPACTTATITLSRVDVLVADTNNAPQEGLTVWWETPQGAGDGYSVTPANGHVLIPTPPGSYRFVTNVLGLDFVSGDPGHCTVPGCTSAIIRTQVPVTVTVRDTNGAPKANQEVYAYNSATDEYAGFVDTDANGVALLFVPPGAHQFFTEMAGNDYSSGPPGHCVIPGCTSASIAVAVPVTVTVTDTAGAPIVASQVVWVNAAGVMGGLTNTNASGVATLTPPLEAVRFRATVDNTQFFSAASAHCSQPGCTSATISVSQLTVVTVVDGAGAPISGRVVTAVADEAIPNKTNPTSPSGQATFRLPFAHWRFRATCAANNEQFFSGNAGHCFLPGGCLTARITMPCGVCVGKQNNTACEDANPCTITATCQSQRCVAGTPRTCTASDQCHDVGACAANSPSTWTCSNPPKANGASCNDTNLCTQTDSCQAGACVGANPMVCSASDQCHDAGTCNPGTGVCSNPAKTNGTSCNDSNACTQTDACQGGACVGANPVVCAAQDQCHVGGTCNPATGTCSASSRATDGTACSDGNRCSSGDSCRAGTCLPGTTNACAGTGQPNYVSVIDLGSVQGWSYATGINSSGVVVGADGPPEAGIYQLGTAGSKGFRWSEAEGRVYVPWSGVSSYAVDINDAGVMSVSAGNVVGSTLPCRYDPAVDAQPVCQPAAGNASGINAAGILTGASYHPFQSVRMFRLGTGPIEILPSAAGPDPRAKGVAIAADGSILGTQLGADGGWFGVRFTEARGSERLLDLLPAGSGWTTANGSSIRQGEILGWGYHGGLGRAFRMKTAPNGDVTAIVALPMPSTFAPEAANIMSASTSNASGEIVGAVFDALPFWPQAAFVHTDATGSIDLNTLIDPQSGWTLKAASDVNDNHEVVGYGVHEGVYRAFKLKLPDLAPCPMQNNCRTGVRDPLTGVCSYNVSPDGAACDDANACTQGETCAAGVCQGGTTFACAAPDTCHTAGTCNPARPAAPPPSTQDLLGWWRMEGNGDDATGGGHPLTNEGAVPAPGRFGQGMRFDGASCMTAPIWEEARMQGASGVTVMAWINPSQQLVCPTPGQGLTIAGRGWDYSQGIGCFSAAPAASLKEEVRIAGTVETAQGWGYPGGWGAALPNQWMHVAFTWDHANLIMYVNGRLISIRPRSGQFGNYEPTFAVGCMVAWYFTENQRIQQFKGTIDEVMLYRRALSPAELGAYYAASDPCDHPTLADGTTCNDSNACTQTDTCQTGACVGGNPKTCAAQDQCHAAGACNPANGVCSNPVKPDGAACNDGQTCTQSETCLAGACQDTNDHPTVVNLPVQDLGSLGQIQSFPYDINSSGAVVGWSSTDDWQNHATRFSGTGPLVNLAAQLGLAPPSSAQAINDANTVVGFQTLSDGSHAFRYGAAGLEDFGLVGDGSYVLNNETVLHAGTWVRGAFPTDINNGGDFVGFYTIGGTFGGFRFTDGAAMEDVGTLVAGGATLMEGIAESGTAVGTAATGATTHAVLYENPIVGLFDLNNLIDPLSGWVLASAGGASGDFIVGTGFRNGDGVPRPYRLHRSSGVVDDLSHGWLHSGARAVNAAGDVVGTGFVNEANAAIAFSSAFVYTDHLGFKNLDDLIPRDFSWTLMDARRINDAGEIIGWGYHTGQEGPRPFRIRLPSGQSASCQARGLCGGGEAICLFSDGVVETSPGQFVAVFGYDSSAPSSVQPTVNQVRLDGNLVANPQPSPPAQLPPGTHAGAFVPKFESGHEISWTVNGETVTASATTGPRLQPIVLPGGALGVVIDGTTIVIRPAPEAYDDPPSTSPTAQDVPNFGGGEYHGSVTGQFAVSPSGASTYSVPIAVPPGIAGMVPNLSLVYNSQGGNGIAGQGWELSGLSMINRCPKTRLQDGQARQVTMGDLLAGDGFCLDGQRLFESATPGEYETEIRDFSRIKRLPDPNPSAVLLASNRAYFTVETKTGETRYYGSRAIDGESKSRVLLPDQVNPANGKAIAIWLLDRVVDAFGNYYDIHYNNDQGDFETEGLRVTAIDYTGRMPGSARAEDGTLPSDADRTVAPFHHMTFGYADNRADTRTARIGKSPLPKKHLLTSITTPLGAYAFVYETPDVTLPSRLKEIRYCTTHQAPPANPEVCLDPLVFDWDGGDYRWEEVAGPQYQLPVPINGSIVDKKMRSTHGTTFADLDGDGRVDFMEALENGFTTVWRNRGLGLGWGEMPQWRLPAKLFRADGRPAGAMFAEVDGDGRLDLIASPSAGTGCVPAPGKNVCIWLNRIKQDPTCATTAACWQRDDGRASVPASYFATAPINPPDGWGAINLEPDANRDVLADLNGDGKIDIARGGPGDCDLRVLISTPNGFVAPQESYLPPACRRVWAGALLYHFADVNRDGLADLVGNGTPNFVESWTTAFINTGVRGPGAPIWKVVTLGADPRADAPIGGRVLADLDGDGFLDSVANYANTAGVALSTGDGFTEAGTAGFVNNMPGPIYSGPGIFDLFDLNADGLADLIENVNPRRRLRINSGTAWVNPGWDDLPAEDPRTLPIWITAAEPQRGTAFVDLDGDGVLDIVEASDYSLPGQPVKHAWLNKFRPPVIIKFPNGLARKTEVDYSVITTRQATDDGVYIDDYPKGVDTTYQIFPLRVVSSARTEDGRGLGAMATTRYEYHSMRGSSDGRGPQGFKRIDVRSPGRLRTSTEYNQNHPYSGTPRQVNRYYDPPSGPPVLLSETLTKFCNSLVENQQGEPICTFGEAETPATPVQVYPVLTIQTDFLRVGEITSSEPPEKLVTRTDFRYDNRGNPTLAKVTTSTEGQGAETYEKKTENFYGTPGSELQRLGKVSKVIVTSRRVAPLGPSIVHTTEFDYGVVSQWWDPGPHDTLALTKKRLEPNGGASIEARTAYLYDRFGNVIATTDCASDLDNCAVGRAGPADLPYRTSRVSFDPDHFNAPSGPGLLPSLGYTHKGRFPVRKTNAEGHNEYSAYDPVKGVLLQKTGVDGIHTCYEHTDFGRERTVIERCGSATPLRTETNTYRTTTADPVFASIVTLTVPSNGATSWIYGNVLGRKIYARSRGFDGYYTEATTVYDERGRVITETKPHRLGQLAFGTVTGYDQMGRVRSVTQALGDIDGSGTMRSSIGTVKYLGLTTRTEQSRTNEDGQLEIQAHEERKNALGKVAWVTDALCVPGGACPKTQYEYDPDGNSTKVTDTAGHVVELVYDKRGRKERSIDPNLGTWVHVYNAFGDLTGQRDARQKVIAMRYDMLGRRTVQTDVETGKEARWVYDVAPGAGVGKLAAVVGEPDDALLGTCAVPYALPSSEKRAVRAFSYTQFGELRDDSHCIDGSTFTATNEYDDARGRLEVIRYPEVNGNRLAVQYHYTTLGYLHYVTDAADGSLLWAATAMNALGQVTAETMRNGVETVSTRNPSTGWLLGSSSTARAEGNTLIQGWTNRFDEIGNLRERTRSAGSAGPGFTETFVYDRLNRVKSAHVQAQGYDGTELYDYDGIGNLVEKAGKTFSYGTCGAGPHAVCGEVGGPQFQYDVNGNMTAGNGRTVTYNLRNKPIHIDSAPPVSQGNDVGTADFIYDGDGNRVVQEIGSPSRPNVRTVYVGMGPTGKTLHERTTRDNGNTFEHAQFIYAGGTHGGSAFALRVVTNSGSGQAATANVAMKYYHHDHLGSVTAMSDETGHVIGPEWGGANATSLGYDAWGARRGPDGRPAPSASFNQQPGRREFTGHETIPNVGLVNMNGRVYDPALGRFLSPDPNVQFVNDPQNLNRYTYVLNNPLRYTDPSGFFLGLDLKKWNSSNFLGYKDFNLEEFLLEAVAYGACAAGPLACSVGQVVLAVQKAELSLASGTPFSQVAISTTIGYVSGKFGGALGDGLIGGTAGEIVGSGIGGGVGAAITTKMYGGSLGPNILEGILSGALEEAIQSGLKSMTVSKASANGAGTGAARLERSETVEAVLKAHGYGRVVSDAELFDDADWSDFQRNGHEGGVLLADAPLGSIDDVINLLGLYFDKQALTIDILQMMSDPNVGRILQVMHRTASVAGKLADIYSGAKALSKGQIPLPSIVGLAGGAISSRLIYARFGWYGILLGTVSAVGGAVLHDIDVPDIYPTYLQSHVDSACASSSVCSAPRSQWLEGMGIKLF